MVTAAALIGYSNEMDTSTLRTIGQGSCGTVWASETGPAYKRGDGSRHRSLQNDFKMHQRVLRSLKTVSTIRICIPKCHAFIEAENSTWWSANYLKFPPGFRTPCNLLQSQRIKPFPESVRHLLISNYCPPNLASEIATSVPNNDCLIRPYLGRRRIQSSSRSRIPVFSLRNYPLHLDQLEALGVTRSHIEQYARIMAETLAAMHWVGEIDGNDIEFVLASSSEDTGDNFHTEGAELANMNSGIGFQIESEVLGKHSLWVLDFDLCREITMDSAGAKQAAIAFWRNDPFYPRPGKILASDSHLWTVFRESYLRMSAACTDVLRGLEEAERTRRRSLSEEFILLVEQEGAKRTTA